MAFATHINKPLEWWRQKLSVPLRRALSSIWLYSLAATLICWVMVMQMGIFGYFPGKENPDTILNIVFHFLLSTVLPAFITFTCAIAGDIENRYATLVI